MLQTQYKSPNSLVADSLTPKRTALATSPGDITKNIGNRQALNALTWNGKIIAPKNI